MTDGSGPQVHPRVRVQLECTPDDGGHAEILALWKAHSIAEDARDLDGLIATLAPDCVYELVGELAAPENRWEGHDGARRFYTDFLGAFPDVEFFLQDITIGPQGVTEIAKVKGTHVADFAGWAATGAATEFMVAIVFPWDPVSGRFGGERVLAVPPMTAQTSSPPGN